MIASQAVPIAIAIDWDGRRQALAVQRANRESRSSWPDFLLRLKARRLHSVEFFVADDRAGLPAALRQALAEAAYQRCCRKAGRDEAMVILVCRLKMELQIRGTNDIMGAPIGGNW